MGEREKILAALPVEPMRIREIAQAAGVPTRNAQAWVGCYAVLGRAVRHDVGKRRPLWSAANLPPKAQWLMAAAQLPAAFTTAEASEFGVHSVLLRAAEVVGLVVRDGARRWRLADAV